MNNSRDDVLFDVLSDSGQIIQFFESIFGFLYRRTDFFKVQKSTEEEFGFPPGVAERLVLKIFKQWESLAKQDDLLEQMNRLGSDGVAPPACQELEVTASEAEVQPTLQDSKTSQTLPELDRSCEGYNGAVREGYSWSQSISDVDVIVDVGDEVTSAKQLSVQVTAQTLNVEVKGHSQPLLQGEFPWRTKKEDGIWSLVPGKHVQVHLEKCEERWWENLLTSEVKIDLSHIDSSRPLDEFSQFDQMKVQQLVWDQERREQGVPTPAPSTTTEDMLRKAWHQEGSPFKDMPFDPSLVQFEKSASHSDGT